MLSKIQTNTSIYVKKFLKNKRGMPDSAFFCILILLNFDDPKIREIVNVTWIWDKKCNNCGLKTNTSLNTKTIITLPKVVDYFQPESPTSMYICSCKTEQEMRLVYKELSKCLIFHFERGAGEGNNCIPSKFAMGPREYHLTGVILLKRSSDSKFNHFVTWVRHPTLDMWLECNDLHIRVMRFSAKKPEFVLRDLYMCMYEAFDDFGTIQHETSAIDIEQNQNVKAEVIDLSDEGEDPKSALTNVIVEPSTPEQRPLCESLDAISNYLAENSPNKKLEDCKEERDSSQTLKIPDTEQLSNMKECNTIKIVSTESCVLPCGPSSSAEYKVEEELKNLKKMNVTPVETVELHAGNEVLNSIHQKEEIDIEKQVSSKETVRKSEDDHEMLLSNKNEENASKKLEEADINNSRSDSLISQTGKNLPLEKKGIAEPNLAQGTSKTTDDGRCVNRFSVKNKKPLNINKSKASNSVVSDEVCERFGVKNKPPLNINKGETSNSKASDKLSEKCGVKNKPPLNINKGETSNSKASDKLSEKCGVKNKPPLNINKGETLNSKASDELSEKCGVKNKPPLNINKGKTSNSKASDGLSEKCGVKNKQPSNINKGEITKGQNSKTNETEKKDDKQGKKNIFEKPVYDEATKKELEQLVDSSVRRVFGNFMAHMCQKAGKNIFEK